MKKIHLTILTILLFAACSTTENIPDGDQLFVGLTKITYDRNDTIANTAVSKKNSLALRLCILTSSAALW